MTLNYSRGRFSVEIDVCFVPLTDMDDSSPDVRVHGGSCAFWSRDDSLDLNWDRPTHGIADGGVLLSVGQQVVEFLIRTVRLNVHTDADLFVAWRYGVIETEETLQIDIAFEYG